MCDSKSKIFNNHDYFPKCFSRLLELKIQRKICDVTLVFNQERLKAHSAVLAAGSDYFYSVFNSDSKKNGEMTYNDICLKSVNSKAVVSLVDYLYTGVIQFTEENIFNILSVASLFQLQIVINECLEFIEKLINFTNCIEVLKLAAIHNSSSLENRAIDFLQMNFKKVSESEEFLNIEVNNLKMILDNDFLNVSSEDEVFESVKRWVEYDQNRNEYITSLMECVRLPYVSNEIIFDRVLPLCGTYSSCSKLVLETIQTKLTNKKNLLSEKQMKPRKSANTLLIIGAYELNRASIIEIYNPSKNKWCLFMDMKMDRKNFGVAMLNNTFLIIGGFLGHRVVKTVESINYETGEKKSMPPLLTARGHIFAVKIAGSIYVPGGRGDSHSAANLTEKEGLVKPVTSMERWDIDEQKWYYSTPMITPRECYGVAIVDKEFYVVGGWSSGSASDSAEAFCPVTGKWRKCASMLVKRNWVGVGHVNGYIYAVGGRSGYNYMSVRYESIERYDPQIDVWTIVTNYRAPRYATGVGSIGKKMIAIGGAINSGIVSDVDEYDPEKNTWKPLAPLLAPREETVVFSVPITLLNQKCA